MNATRTVIMAMVIALAMIGTLGFAAATEDVTVSIGDGNRDVILPITVDNVTNLGSCEMRLDFDETIVSVTDVVFGEMDNTIVNQEHVGEGWIYIVAYQGSNDVLTGDITIVEVTFAPVDQCSLSSCNLELTVDILVDSTPESNTIPCDTDDGEYTDVLCGDIDYNGVVNIMDAAYLANHRAGMSAYTNIVCSSAADVNGDEVVNIADASYLAKHLAIITGYEELMC